MASSTEKIPTSRKDVTNKDIFDFLTSRVLPELTSISNNVQSLEVRMQALENQGEKMREIVLGNGKVGMREQVNQLVVKVQAIEDALGEHDIILYGKKSDETSKGVKERLGDIESWINTRGRIEWLFIGAVVAQIVIIAASLIFRQALP